MENDEKSPRFRGRVLIDLLKQILKRKISAEMKVEFLSKAPLKWIKLQFSNESFINHSMSHYHQPGLRRSLTPDWDRNLLTPSHGGPSVGK